MRVASLFFLRKIWNRPAYENDLLDQNAPLEDDQPLTSAENDLPDQNYLVDDYQTLMPELKVKVKLATQFMSSTLNVSHFLLSKINF